jgi:hypothetical protein
MAHPHHNINMMAIKNEDEDIFEKRPACLFLVNLTGRLRLSKISYLVIAGYR